ncbi:MAG: hypothetical protein PHR53_00365 [Bacteroidales bacterium]|nr:hypothetical protein [Bacteroidales bacterium]
MKKQIAILMGLIMILCVIHFLSCKKDRLNFKDLNSIEADGVWSLPLINTQYPISEVLSQFDREGYISTADDGTLKYVYELTQDNVVRASDLLKFDDVDQVDETELDNPSPGIVGASVTLEYNQQLSFASELVEVNSATVKTGLLDVQIAHDIDVDEYDVVISTTNIKTEDGVFFSKTLHSNQGLVIIFSINLENCTITLEPNNTIAFQYQFHFLSNGDETPMFHVNTEIHLSNFSLKDASAKVAAYSMPLSVETPFNLFSTNFGGDITIFNPRLVLYTRNSFNVEGLLRVDVAEFTGDNCASSLLEIVPTLVNIPISPNEYIKDQIEEIEKIHFESLYNRFVASGMATLNPNGFSQGVISVYDTSTISVKVAAELPFQLKIDNAYYRDTTSFTLSDIKEVDHIEALDFRVALTNGIPLDVDAQIIAYDSITNTVVDSMFTEAEFLDGAYDGIPVERDPIFVHITNERIQNFLKANKLIMRFKIATEGHEVTFTSENFLGAVVGVSVTYSGADIEL